MKTHKRITAAGVSLAASIALTILLKPGCQYASVHVGNEIARAAVIVLLPCLALGILGSMFYDLLSYVTFGFGQEPTYDDVVITMGEQGEWTASRPLKFLVLYPLMIVIWGAVALIWLAAINCPNGTPAWIPA